MIFFHQREGEVHSCRNAGRGIDVFVPNKYWIGINVCARGAPDQNLAPVPMRCRASAIKQAGSRQQHCACADRADSPGSPSRSFQPADYVSAYFILLDRAATSHEQGVDVSAQLAKSLMRHDSHTAVREKGAVRGSGYDRN
jgi:hypothetical protein